MVFALLLVSVALFPLRWVTVKMLPFDNKSELQVLVDMPEGTTLETTRRVIRDMAQYLKTVPEVTDLELYSGTNAPINFNGLVRHYDLRQGSQLGDIQVNLRHKEERSDQSHDIAKRVRPPLVEIAERYGARVKVVEVPPGPPVLSTLVAEVYGPSETVRLELAERIRKMFEQTEGVVDVDWLVEAPQPKTEISVDREKAALHGVPAARIVETLRHAFGKDPVGLLHAPDAVEAVPILLELPRSERSELDSLLSLRVVSQSGALVPIKELVTVEERTLQPSLFRKNLRPVTYVTGDVAGVIESPVYAIMDLSDRIQKIAPDEIVPDAGPGFGRSIVQLWTHQPTSEEKLALKWDGEWHITYEVFRDLGAAFGVVLVLIYLLLIGWFGSFKTPLVMMIAIPLSLVGILPGHLFLGAFFTATSMIGFIALAGIMVRNSVLLIDFAELSLSRGRSLEQAVLEAGAVRFRPILLTAGTVVVGAFVILFDPIFQGLAISLMFGTLASTVLTLVVVPLVYYLMEKAQPPGGGDRGEQDAAPDESTNPQLTPASTGRPPEEPMVDQTMLMILCAEERVDALLEVLDAHPTVTGFTELRDLQGSGSTGRHLGTRAFPGSVSMVLTLGCGGRDAHPGRRPGGVRQGLPAGIRPPRLRLESVPARLTTASPRQDSPPPPLRSTGWRGGSVVPPPPTALPEDRPQPFLPVVEDRLEVSLDEGVDEGIEEDGVVDPVDDPGGLRALWLSGLCRGVVRRALLDDLFEQVLVVPEAVGALALLVDEAVGRVPGGDFAPPGERQAVDAEAVVDQRAPDHLDRPGGDDREGEPGRGELFEVAGVGEEGEDLVDRPGDVGRALEAAELHGAPPSGVAPPGVAPKTTSTSRSSSMSMKRCSIPAWTKRVAPGRAG